MTILHSLLMFALPVACGFGLAWQFNPRHWQTHLAAFVSAISLSIFMAFGGFLVAVGLTTGSWPQEITVAGLAYALAWFSIPAIFTIGPVVALGYGGGVWVRTRCSVLSLPAD
jgi:hypothetical protein